MKNTDNITIAALNPEQAVLVRQISEYPTIHEWFMVAVIGKTIIYRLLEAFALVGILCVTVFFKNWAATALAASTIALYVTNIIRFYEHSLFAGEALVGIQTAYHTGIERGRQVSSQNNETE